MHIFPLFPLSCHSNLVLNRLGVVDSKALRRKNDVELELTSGRPARALVLAGGRVVLDGLEVDHEVVLDGEDGVGGEPGVVFGVDLGDDGLVVFVGDLFRFVLARCWKEVVLVIGWILAYHEVDVRRAHWVPVDGLEELV